MHAKDVRSAPAAAVSDVDTELLQGVDERASLRPALLSGDHVKIITAAVVCTFLTMISSTTPKKRLMAGSTPDASTGAHIGQVVSGLEDPCSASRTNTPGIGPTPFDTRPVGSLAVNQSSHEVTGMPAEPADAHFRAVSTCAAITGAVRSEDFWVREAARVVGHVLTGFPGGVLAAWNGVFSDAGNQSLWAKAATATRSRS
jgi:hypothetical protein